MTPDSRQSYAPLMKRLGVLVLVLIAGVLVAAPAQAAAPTFTVSDVPDTPPGECALIPFTYAANPSAGYSQVSVILSTENFSTYATYAGANRTDVFRFCGATPGPHSLAMSVSTCTSSYSSCQDYDGPTASFYIGPRPVYPPYVPPTLPPVTTPPAPTGPSAKCRAAKKALKKAKKAHNQAAIYRARAKVKRAC